VSCIGSRGPDKPGQTVVENYTQSIRAPRRYALLTEIASFFILWGSSGHGLIHVVAFSIFVEKSHRLGSQLC